MTTRGPGRGPLRLAAWAALLNGAAVLATVTGSVAVLLVRGRLDLGTGAALAVGALAGLLVVALTVAAVTQLAEAAQTGLCPKLAIERVVGEPVMGSGLEEQIIAAGFSRQPRRLVASV